MALLVQDFRGILFSASRCALFVDMASLSPSFATQPSQDDPLCLFSSCCAAEDNTPSADAQSGFEAPVESASEAYAETALTDAPATSGVAIPVSSEQMEAVQSSALFDPALGTPVSYTCASPGIRNQAVLLTYARCVCPLQSLLEQLQGYKSVSGCRGVVESHKDGTPHVHVYMQKSKTLMTWEKLSVQHGGVRFRPNVRVLRTHWHQWNAFEYLSKEGTPIETGRFMSPVCPRRGSGQSSGSELLAIAAETTVEQAVHQYVAEGG